VTQASVSARAIASCSPGGAFMASTSTLTSINSSFPSNERTSWKVYLNNTSGVATTFTVRKPSSGLHDCLRLVEPASRGCVARPG
jgi:hypothetical protein